MPKAKHIFIGAVVLVGVGVAGALLLVRPEASRAERNDRAATRGTPAALDLYEVARIRFDITTTATGELRAKRQIEIRNELEFDSQIVEVIAEGTFVRQGDVLVRLNAEDIQQKIDEESLQLKSAQADAIASEEEFHIQESENDSAFRAASLKVELAQLDLQKWMEGEVKIKRLEQAHGIERAEKEVDRLGEVVEKSRALHAEGFYATDRLKQDERDYEQAVNDLAKARLEVQVYEEYEFRKDEKQKNSDLEEARAELERVVRQNQSRLASKMADRDNKKELLAQRQRMMAKYEQQLAKTTILAPAPGLAVYATSLEGMRWGDDSNPLAVGSKVWPNQTLLILPDTSEMIAAVKVHESLAGRVRRGQRALVKVDAMGEERFPGVVESIGILAENTGGWRDPDRKEYTVRISLDAEAVRRAAERADPDDDVPAGEPRAAAAGNGDDSQRRGLKPSMRCEAEVVLGSVEEAIAIPIQAVFSEGPMRYAFLKEGQRYAKRPLLVGRRSDRYAEVLAGVTPGDKVLLRRPDAGEVISRPLDPKQLAAAGLALDDNGRVVSAQGAGGRGPGGRPGAMGTRPVAMPVRPDPADMEGEAEADDVDDEGGDFETEAEEVDADTGQGGAPTVVTEAETSAKTETPPPPATTPPTR